MPTVLDPSFQCHCNIRAGSCACSRSHHSAQTFPLQLPKAKGIQRLAQGYECDNTIAQLHWLSAGQRLQDKLHFCRCADAPIFSDIGTATSGGVLAIPTLHRGASLPDRAMGFVLGLGLCTQKLTVPSLHPFLVIINYHIRDSSQMPCLLMMWAAAHQLI